MDQKHLSLTERQTLVTRAAYASTGVAALLILAKTIVFFFTGSVAILGSLLDSLLDSGASVLNLVAVQHAAEPADDAHRFGHGKAEALAGLGQAVFITISAVVLAWQAFEKMLHPTPVENAGYGVAVMLFSIVMTLALVWYQRRVITQTHSTAISADSLHYTGDVLLNGSVALSLLAGKLVSWPWLDGIAALVIAGLILVGSVKIVLRSADELMDRELPLADRQKIRELALTDTRVRNLHDVRTRRAGQKIFIELHLEMDGTLPLFEAHAIAENAMIRIEQAYPHADVLVHQDPAGIVEERQAIQEI